MILGFKCRCPKCGYESSMAFDKATEDMADVVAVLECPGECDGYEATLREMAANWASAHPDNASAAMYWRPENKRA